MSENGEAHTPLAGSGPGSTAHSRGASPEIEHGPETRGHVAVRFRWLSGAPVDPTTRGVYLSDLNSALWNLDQGNVAGVRRISEHPLIGHYELVYNKTVLNETEHYWLPDHLKNDSWLTVVFRVSDPPTPWVLSDQWIWEYVRGFQPSPTQ